MGDPERLEQAESQRDDAETLESDAYPSPLSADARGLVAPEEKRGCGDGQSGCDRQPAKRVKEYRSGHVGGL